MVFLFEIYPPFRWHIKVEKTGPMTRIIWGWFSFAFISAGLNEVGDAFRKDEREKLGVLRRSTNEWSDTTKNAVEWLKRIKSGLSTPDEALKDLNAKIEQCKHIRNSDKI